MSLKFSTVAKLIQPSITSNFRVINVHIWYLYDHFTLFIHCGGLIILHALNITIVMKRGQHDDNDNKKKNTKMNKQIIVDENKSTLVNKNKHQTCYKQSNEQQRNLIAITLATE